MEMVEKGSKSKVSTPQDPWLHTTHPTMAVDGWNWTQLSMSRASNFPKGDDRLCIMCGETDETTEHLFQCRRYQELTGHNLRWSDNGDHWKDLQWLKEAAHVVEHIEEIRDREIKRY